jgi:hypothetical protein
VLSFSPLCFVFGLKWLPGTSSMSGGFEFKQLILPAMVLIVYDFGYVARMTRASMAEVMTSQYIRTAVLKGLPYKRHHQTCPAQRPDRAFHGHHAADQLAVVRGHRRGILSLPTKGSGP